MVAAAKAMLDTMELLPRVGASSCCMDAVQVHDLQEDGAAKGMVDEPCGAGMEKARANEAGMVLLAEVCMVLPSEVGLVLLDSWTPWTALQRSKACAVRVPTVRVPILLWLVISLSMKIILHHSQM